MSYVYVDDLWTRAPDLESAMKLRESIIAVRSSTGFDIYKWSSRNLRTWKDTAKFFEKQPLR